jgi:hypothetical protein
MLLVLMVGFVVLPALAQAPPQGIPARVRGTVDKLDGKTLTVNSKEGGSVAVTLADDASVTALVKKPLAEIKPGDTVASTGIKGKDGKINAIEVRVLPKPFADGGRQFPWDLMPDSVMTNATIGSVTETPDGASIHVTFKDGESDYTVGPDTVILANSPADTSLLVRGASVVVFALKQNDGRLTSRFVFAEKDGVKPPM